MVGGIILASGLSKRFGENKLLLTMGKQRVIEHVIDQVKLSNLKELHLVYGHHEQEFRSIAENKKISLIYNPEYAQGQSMAVKRGVEALGGKVRGILFLLGDQPFIHPQTINRMIRHFYKHPDAIILPVHRGKRGNPVLFSQKFFGEMLLLKGDEGARSLIHRHPQHIISVPVENGMELFDIDDGSDYKKALHWFQKRTLDVDQE